jgi:hypothetical protein
VSDDAYIRLTRHGIRSFGSPRGPGSLLFVDVEPGQSLADLRRADFSIFREVGVILARGTRKPAGPPGRSDGSQAPRLARTMRRVLRLPPSNGNAENSMLRELVDALSQQHLNPFLGLIHQPLGRPATVATSMAIGSEYLDRARAVELEALLHWGNGIWTPGDYHYRLPSGEHAAGFVRLADAFRIPRDAEVLATWLYPRLQAGIGLVLDTGTLSPLALAVGAALRTQGMEPGPVEVLDGYPATSHQVHASVDQAKQFRSVLAILSVNSSGRIRDLFHEAMRDLQRGVTGSIDVLVSKQPVERSTEQDSGVQTSVWHPLPGRDPLLAYGAENSEGCQLCADPNRSRIVPISPTSFDGTFEAAIHRLMPSVDDANENRALWEKCDESSAIHLESKAEEAVEGWRSEETMPIKLSLGTLTDLPQFRIKVVEALQKRLEARETPPIKADLVLGAAHETKHSGFKQVIDDLASVLGKPDILSFPVETKWPEELNEKVRDAGSIAIVALGSVTGISLLSALTATQRVRRPGDPIIAIVIHARPQQRRAWQTLENAFGGRLYPAFHSYFPDRSPLSEEEILLNSTQVQKIRAEADPSVKALIRRRIDFCKNPETAQAEDVFWGSTPTDSLTPNSFFGEGLHSATIYAAVGAAMERARQEAKSKAAPEQRVFDLPSMVRSYYDPLILSAAFRWLKPHEQWWGIQSDGEATMHEVFSRFHAVKDLRILVAELLLASALGKLSREATSAVRGYADHLTNSSDLDEAQRAAVRLGLLLAPSYSTADEERARERASRM